MLEIIEPGLSTTVQDRGRPDWTQLGVPIGGACDPWSLAVANVLAGSEPDAAALEMTIVGPVFAVRGTIVIGLAGADLGGIERERGRRLVPGRSYRLTPGSTIAFPGSPSAAARPGARAYLAVRGGVDVPVVLGSRSTSVAGGFGGIDGRPLVAGDVVRPGRAGTTDDPGEEWGTDRVWPSLAADPLAGPADRPIRLLPGPAGGVEALCGVAWRVAAGSDRVGLRLEGPPIDAEPRGDLPSHGVVFGAIQLPPDGRPVVLLADHQTTGGYPVAAVAISADRLRLGQLRPGATVTFEATTPAEAVEALRAQRDSLAGGAAIVRQDAGWEALWQAAGG